MRLVLLVALSVPLFAQGKVYMAEHKAALSAAAETFTVQLPAGTQKNVVFTAASIYCSAACEFTVERDGTLATGTVFQPLPLNSGDGWGTALAYFSSNVGAGTTIARHIVPAGSTMVLDFTNKTMVAGQNLTIRTASITGTAIINMQWREN